MINEKGFTLTEILVVILIISITFGFALLAFGDFGESRKIKMATEQFANTVKLLQHQAIIESSTLGLMIHKDSYQAYRFHLPDQWLPISNRGIFAKQHFPKNTVVIFQSERKPHKMQPDIVINSSGDQTPFILKTGSKKEFPLIILLGKHNGNLYFEYPKES